MSRGLFITLEGPDGAGKSTQISNIADYFRKRGKEVVISREPGGTPISEKLREIVLDKANSEMDDVTEMMIYAAARAQHVSERIRPAVERGDVVVCDRFVDSSIAYQGFGRGLGDTVRQVNMFAVQGVMPDITFLMDIDPLKGRARIAAGRGVSDRLESEKMDFHYKVYEGFKAIAEREPERVIVIDADRGIDAVRSDIYKRLDELCEARGI